jgi:glycerol uptake facilitator-like aquaporin
LTDTFTGIKTSSVPMFIVAQSVGAIIGFFLAKFLVKGERNNVHKNHLQ